MTNQCFENETKGEIVNTILSLLFTPELTDFYNDFFFKYQNYISVTATTANTITTITFTVTGNVSSLLQLTLYFYKEPLD